MQESHGTARLIAALAFAVLVLATAVGNAVGTAASERTGAATAVDGVVLHDSPDATQAPLAWNAPDGTTGIATVRVPAGTDAGDTRRLWIGPDGTVVPQPPPGAAPWLAALLAALVGTLAAAAVVVARAAVHRRERERDLALEWARVEPVWTGRDV